MTLVLALEVGLFLWLAEAFSVPLPAAVTLALTVTAALVAVLVSGSKGARRPWPATVALVTAAVLSAVMAAFMIMALFLVFMQGALAGKGILPFLAVIIVLAFALFLDTGLPLFLALLLVLTFALGVLMGPGPLPLLSVPMVLSVGVGVGVVLFQAISPGQGRVLRRLPGEGGRSRSSV